MSLDEAKDDLLAADLHEESVERMLSHYESMQFHLQAGEHGKIGNDVGNFCENAANVVLSSIGKEVPPHINLNNFAQDAENGELSISAARDLVLTIPRMLRAAYELRSTRDFVHAVLNNPVNRADSQTAVEICSWVVAELVRLHGDEDHMDEIAAMIEVATSPDTPFIENYDDHPPLVLHEGLTTGEEILVHLYFADGHTLHADELIERIPGSTPGSVRGSLGNYSSSRAVRYNSDIGVATITGLGKEKARILLESEFSEEDYLA